MVTFMCVYAREIALSRLPGPYTDPDARRFARACLLTPGLGELLERPDLDLPRAAAAIGIPKDELGLERTERTN